MSFQSVAKTLEMTIKIQMSWRHLVFDNRIKRIYPFLAKKQKILSHQYYYTASIHCWQAEQRINIAQVGVFLLPNEPRLHPGVGLLDVDDKPWPTLGQEGPRDDRARRHAVDDGQVLFGHLGLNPFGLQLGQVHLWVLDRHVAVEVRASHRPLAHRAAEQYLETSTSFRSLQLWKSVIRNGTNFSGKGI